MKRLPQEEQTCGSRSPGEHFARELRLTLMAAVKLAKISFGARRRCAAGVVARVVDEAQTAFGEEAERATELAVAVERGASGGQKAFTPTFVPPPANCSKASAGV